MKHTYNADKVWRYLRKYPGITQKDLRAKLGWGSNKTAQVLGRLRKAGYARHDGGRQVHTQWYAVGDMPPQCRWGMHPNSVAGLQVGWERNIEYLRLAFIARGFDPDKIGKGRQKQFTPLPFGEPCSLAECWTMPLSRKQAA